VKTLTSICLGLLCCGLLAQVARGAEPRLCFGQRDTITDGAASSTIVGTAGHDVVFAGAGSDVVLGRGGDDLLCGGYGGDSMYGARGNDKVSGGPTPFNLVDGGPGNDYLRGYGSCCAALTGGDTLSYRSAPGPVTVNLLTGTATGQGTDTFVAFAGVDGSNFGDRLIAGDSYAGDAIRGFAGNDVIIGFDGSSFEGEMLLGGTGNDVIRGRDGVEHIVGGLGDDTLDGGPNTPDGYSYVGGDTAMYGGFLNSSMWVWEGTGGGSVTVDLAAETATGEQGRDTLLGVEDVIGSTDDDTLLGDAGDNFLDGHEGTDTIDGRGGTDSCAGEILRNCE